MSLNVFELQLLLSWQNAVWHILLNKACFSFMNKNIWLRLHLLDSLCDTTVVLQFYSRAVKSSQPLKERDGAVVFLLPLYRGKPWKVEWARHGWALACRLQWAELTGWVAQPIKPCLRVKAALNYLKLSGSVRIGSQIMGVKQGKTKWLSSGVNVSTDVLKLNVCVCVRERWCTHTHTHTHIPVHCTAQTSVLTSVQTPSITTAVVHSVIVVLSVRLCVPLFTVVSALLHCERSLQLCPPACWLTQCCGSAVWAHRAPSRTGCHDAADRTQFTLRPAHLSCCQQPQLEDTNYTTLLVFLLFFTILNKLISHIK